MTSFGTSSVELKSTHLDVLKIDRCDGVGVVKITKYRNISSLDI